MNKEQTLVLIYKHLDSKQLLESGDIWDKGGWMWGYSEKSKGTIITICSPETLEITDERLKVAGMAPLKMIKIWNENDEDLGVRKTPFFARDVDCTMKLRKLERDLLNEFNEAQNSSEETDEHDSEPINERVLMPYNRIEPARPTKKPTNSEAEVYVIHNYYLSCDKKPLININTI